MADQIVVRGYRELSRSFAVMSVELKAELTGTLRAAAEPVRVGSVFNAQSEIENIGPVWSQMRTGVTTSLVYVAPRAHRRGGSPRPNLAPLLGRAMEESLGEHAPEVYTSVEAMLDQLSASNGF